MKEMTRKQANRIRRTIRSRSRIHGTAEQPRLSVFVSNRHVSAQLIDDDASVTLAYASTATGKSDKSNLTQKAETVGAAIAEAAKAKKVKRVVFDRGSKLYHGRVKALADAARAKGLEF